MAGRAHNILFKVRGARQFIIDNRRTMLEVLWEQQGEGTKHEKEELKIFAHAAGDVQEIFPISMKVSDRMKENVTESCSAGLLKRKKKKTASAVASEEAAAAAAAINEELKQE